MSYSDNLQRKWWGALIVVLFLTACYPNGVPPRKLELVDLLIDRDVLPAVLTETWGPFVPTGEDLITEQSISIQFGIDEQESPIRVAQDVYRYPNADISQRKFERVYLPGVAFFEPVNDWTYHSSFADQEFFGCYDWEGRSTQVCEWAGRYQEYLIVFWMRMTPGEASLADIERAVEDIDSLMARNFDRSITVTLTPWSE